ncbi:DUF1648 domain-containing protein [Streptomyces sp. NPDC056411]|uniref:DUF1648 domain-containing protein n=1 Tax=Streptomyces sp. NPDC056411 TaxID=3345813 RepID=UPI0035DA4FD1
MKSAERSAVAPRGRLWALIAVLPFVTATAVVAGVYTSVSARLPDPLATHFGAAGRVDGYSSVHGFLTGCLVVLLVLGTGLGLLVQRQEPSAGTLWAIAVGYATAAGVGYLSCLTLLGNAAATDASAVRLPLWQAAVALGVALAAGALGRLLAGRAPRPPRPAAGDAPRLDLPAGATAGWSRTISTPPLVVLGVLTACGGLVLLTSGSAIAGVALLLSGAAAAAVTAMRVTVDRRGLTLAPLLLSAFRIRFRRIPLARMSEATSRPISVFAEFGGWGYRVRPGRSGLVLRSGDAVVLRLTSGREFVVSVDDAATAAALLNTYLDRARSQQGG